MTTIAISPGPLSLSFEEKKKDFSLPFVVQLECPPSSGQPFLLFCAYMAGHEPCSSFSPFISCINWKVGVDIAGNSFYSTDGGQ